MNVIMRAEKFCMNPGVLETVNSKFGRDDGGIPVLFTADCTCTPLESHKGHGKGRSKEAANGLW